MRLYQNDPALLHAILREDLLNLIFKFLNFKIASFSVQNRVFNLKVGEMKKKLFPRNCLLYKGGEIVLLHQLLNVFGHTLSILVLYPMYYQLLNVLFLVTLCGTYNVSQRFRHSNGIVLS